MDVDFLTEILGPSWGVRDATPEINTSSNSNPPTTTRINLGEPVDTTTPTSSTPTPVSRPPSSADKKSHSIKGKGEC